MFVCQNQNENKANKQQYWCSHFLMLHIDDTMARFAKYCPKNIFPFAPCQEIDMLFETSLCHPTTKAITYLEHQKMKRKKTAFSQASLSGVHCMLGL